MATDDMHSFITTHTEKHGQTTAGTPEFYTESTLDDQQIYYNDSEKKHNFIWNIPITRLRTEDTVIREKHHQIYRKNIHVLMETLNQSDGVHTYQRMYGCVWDEETGESHGLDRYSYNGEDFISLDLKENRHIPSVPQAKPIVEKWNKDTAQLIYLKEYNDYKCVYWLKDYLYFSKKEPEASLLQKNLNYPIRSNYNVACTRDGQALSDSSGLVKSADTRPNDDRTIQTVDQWKMNKNTCVVKHRSLPEPIPTILTEDQIKPPSNASYNSTWFLVIITVIVGLIALWKHRNKLKAWYKKKKTIKSKTEPSQEPAAAQDSLLRSVVIVPS